MARQDLVVVAGNPAHVCHTPRRRPHSAQKNRQGNWTHSRGAGRTADDAEAKDEQERPAPRARALDNHRDPLARLVARVLAE